MVSVEIGLVALFVSGLNHVNVNLKGEKNDKESM